MLAARLPQLSAAIFDMDGVLVDTTSAHARSWQGALNPYLAEQSRRFGVQFEPMDDSDYLRHFNGRTRFEALPAFLESRGIHLPIGVPEDRPGTSTACALANLKDSLFVKHLEGGTGVFESSIELVRRFASSGVRLALVTGSRHAAQLLGAAAIDSAFDVVVDGAEAAELNLPGKPDPATFLLASRRLGVERGATVVIEDAATGVEAGRAGGFRLVIGIDRLGQAELLRKAGADIVVSDLTELLEEFDSEAMLLG